MKITNRLMRVIVSACLACTLIFSGCDDHANEIEQEEDIDSIRKLFAFELDHPAIWNQSEFKTNVNKIDIAGERESYNFLINTYSPRQTQFIGQTEKGSIRRDFTKGITPPFYTTDIYSFQTTDRTPVYLSVGGLDLDSTYTSRADLDQIALPYTVTQSPDINLSNYKAHFTNVNRANTAGESLVDGDRNFYLAGNAYDATNLTHPFIVTLTSRWYFFTNTWTGNISTLTFLDSPGNEIVNMQYVPFDGFYILTINNSTSEMAISYYKEVDLNKNYRHDSGDSYQKLWSTQIGDMSVDKTLANFAIAEDKLFVAGMATTSAGDQAGKLISMNRKTGTILLQTILDYSDDNDAFYGVAKSGKNVFAYGYSHQTKSASDVVGSRGWAVKFTLEGKPIGNYVYAERNTIIEFTAGSGGFEQSNYDERGSFAIGGSQKIGLDFTAFATEFTHSYK
jgi:hypothetical protein